MSQPSSSERIVRLLTVAEAAEILTISERSLWALLAAGRIRRIKLGPRITRLDVADVEAFLAGAKEPAARAG